MVAIPAEFSRKLLTFFSAPEGELNIIPRYFHKIEGISYNTGEGELAASMYYNTGETALFGAKNGSKMAERVRS